MNKITLPDSGAEIAARAQADLEASNAKFNANLKSLFGPNIPVGKQSKGFDDRVGPGLPKFRIGEFHERLVAARDTTRSK